MSTSKIQAALRLGYTIAKRQRDAIRHFRQLDPTGTAAMEARGDYPPYEKGGPAELLELLKVERGLRRLAEYGCNYGDLSPRQERRVQQLEAQAAELAATFGATAYIQGDPRGCMVYLLFPGDLPQGETADRYYNRGIGICI